MEDLQKLLEEKDRTIQELRAKNLEQRVKYLKLRKLVMDFVALNKELKKYLLYFFPDASKDDPHYLKVRTLLAAIVRVSEDVRF